jgi:hypothetical protein
VLRHPSTAAAAEADGGRLLFAVAAELANNGLRELNFTTLAEIPHDCLLDDN